MSRAIDSRALDLNASYLLAHEVVPLGVFGGRLALGMRHLSDVHAIAAVRFVTGLEIDPIALDEAAWASWRKSLIDLSGEEGERLVAARVGAPAGTPVTIRLSECNVHVRLGGDQETSFVATDIAGWSELVGSAGRSASVMVVLSGDVAWQVELPELPENARSLRRALIARSPLRGDELAWSLPTLVVGSTNIAFSVVRKSWLEDRIVSISATSPASMIVTDEAGRLFDLKPLKARWPSRIDLMVGLCLVVMVTALAANTMTKRDSARTPYLQGGARGEARLATGAEPLPPLRAIATITPGVTSQVPDQADGFELVGVVGRLPHDAVALVRPAWGRTVTLRIGDSLLGWRLATIATDRVTLTKGVMRRQVVLAPANPQSM